MSTFMEHVHRDTGIRESAAIEVCPACASGTMAVSATPAGDTTAGTATTRRPGKGALSAATGSSSSP
jgi:hypothetical protein